MFVLCHPDPKLGRVSLLTALAKWFGRPWTVRDFYARFFGGHWGVSKSIFIGLIRAKLPFSINTPISKIPLNSRVLLLSGRGQIAPLSDRSDLTVTVGPNFTSDYKKHALFFREGHVSRLLVPSEWVSKSVRESDLVGWEKIRVWAAATEVPRCFTKLPKQTKAERILVYMKVPHREILDDVLRLLQNLEKPYFVLRYGRHSRLRYLFTIAKSDLVIYIGATESQGLAMQEAWALGKRTLVFKRDVATIPWIRGLDVNGEEMGSIASPYLNDGCGAFWRNIGELRDLLDRPGYEARVPGLLPTTYLNSALTLWKLTLEK